MAYTDFSINCVPDLSDIAQALRTAFSVDLEEIEVSANREELTHKKQLTCEVRVYGAEFPYRLVITTLNHDIVNVDTLEKIAHFCELIGCTGFSSGPEQNTNPYSGMLLYKRKKYQQVLVDQDRLVHQKEIVIKTLGKVFSDPADWDHEAFIERID
jgi:thiamine monophosphate kinase